jgi:DNA (cytosine-5)-methyltransferase 1
MSIPVIDIFAGPGGLGEGFSALLDENDERIFKTVLSIEMEDHAHATLTLRSFFRQFEPYKAPPEYYQVMKDTLTIDKLYEAYPDEFEAAKKEAWKAKLGYKPDSEKPEKVDKRIKEALNGREEWILLGGPPCQAYSIVGRSRRQQTILDASEDEKVDLYKQYLRILAMHNPSVFVMENVKGILSARSTESPVFEKVLNDLSDPVKFADDISPDVKEDLSCPGYKIYSLTKPAKEYDQDGNPVFSAKDFIIRCEEYGIPQTRHRVILLGIRKEIDRTPEVLKSDSKISLSQVIDDLPKLRSGLSREEDSYDNWNRNIMDITSNGAMIDMDEKVAREIKKTIKNLKKAQNGVGDKYVKFHGNSNSKPYRADWFLDKNLDGVSNHTSKSHMGSDLHRYLFASVFATVYNNTSPKLDDFPTSLLPKHKNVEEALKTKKFTDRFRVQIKDEPAKTITSHISKDGHYYIHPDSTQCRSLTVREAARIQTFPDNYFFCGPRTSQYIQVGNAVPPLLANQIAGIVYSAYKERRKAELIEEL